jgi:hypothetical protein
MGMRSVVLGDPSGLPKTHIERTQMSDGFRYLVERYARQLIACGWGLGTALDEAYSAYHREAVNVERFQRSCFVGRLEDVQRLAKEHGAPSVQWMTDIAFRAAAMYGHLQILQWAVAELGVDLKDKYFPDSMILCRHLHVMQWAVENGVCMSSDGRRHCLALACGRANGLGTVQWLCAQGGDPHGTPFENAVMAGMWHIAQWLVQREPEFPWPKHLLTQVMNRWSPNRVAWMRSVLFHSWRHVPSPAAGAL